MGIRGRASSADLAIVQEPPRAEVFPPHPGLTDAERGVWVATVNGKPSNFFRSDHVPILVEYVRAVCRGHVIDEQLRVFDAEWLATDDGLKRYERLSSLANQTAGTVLRLATSMRLTPSSIYRPDKAGTDKPAGKLWKRDE